MNASDKVREATQARAHALRAQWAQELADKYAVGGVAPAFTLAVVPSTRAAALYEVQP